MAGQNRRHGHSCTRRRCSGRGLDRTAPARRRRRRHARGGRLCRRARSAARACQGRGPERPGWRTRCGIRHARTPARALRPLDRGRVARAGVSAAGGHAGRSTGPGGALARGRRDRAVTGARCARDTARCRHRGCRPGADRDHDRCSRCACGAAARCLRPHLERLASVANRRSRGRTGCRGRDVAAAPAGGCPGCSRGSVREHPRPPLVGCCRGTPGVGSAAAPQCRVRRTRI